MAAAAASRLRTRPACSLGEVVTTRFGRVDGVVNCTGHGPKGDIDEIFDDDWHLGMDVLLTNVVRMTRIATPIMAMQGRVHCQRLDVRGVRT